MIQEYPKVPKRDTSSLGTDALEEFFFNYSMRKQIQYNYLITTNTKKKLKKKIFVEKIKTWKKKLI